MKSPHRIVHIKVLYNREFVHVCVLQVMLGSQQGEGGLLSDSVFDWLTLTVWPEAESRQNGKLSLAFTAWFPVCGIPLCPPACLNI